MRTIRVSYHRGDARRTVEQTCTGESECAFTFAPPAGAGVTYAHYSARVEDSAGGTATTPFAYGFHIGEPAGVDIIDLRVPLTLGRGFNVLLVRDTTYSSNAELWTDCIAGGLTVAGWQQLLDEVGFVDAQVGPPVDTFAGADGEANARTYEVFAHPFDAHKPR